MHVFEIEVGGQAARSSQVHQQMLANSRGEAPKA